MCSYGGRALSDLTFIYKQVLIASCPLSHLSGIDVMVSFLFLLVSIKPLQLFSILWLFAFISLPGIVELGCVETGLISTSEVRELSGNFAAHIYSCLWMRKNGLSRPSNLDT